MEYGYWGLKDTLWGITRVFKCMFGGNPTFSVSPPSRRVGQSILLYNHFSFLLRGGGSGPKFVNFRIDLSLVFTFTMIMLGILSSLTDMLCYKCTHIYNRIHQ